MHSPTNTIYSAIYSGYPGSFVLDTIVIVVNIFGMHIHIISIILSQHLLYVSSTPDTGYLQNGKELRDSILTTSKTRHATVDYVVKSAGSSRVQNITSTVNWEHWEIQTLKASTLSHAVLLRAIVVQKCQYNSYLDPSY